MKNLNKIYYLIKLTKPKITQLIIFCSVISMFLSSSKNIILKKIIFFSLGIGLLASSAFILNCIIEKKIDSLMSRTYKRFLIIKKINIFKLILFSFIICLTGIYILYNYINLLTTILTIIVFLCYSIIYTIFIKPYTSQNIVIGGITGAMLPILGWVSNTNNLPPLKILSICLIIFFWTPPHFWSLNLYYYKDYLKSKLPMLPIIYGKNFTKLNIFIYTIFLIFTTFIPIINNMCGIIYLIIISILNIIFFYYSWNIYFNFSKNLAYKTFYYSIFYLFFIFLGLLMDHILLFKIF